MNENSEQKVMATVVVACVVFLGVLWVASDQPTEAEKQIEREWCIVSHFDGGQGYFGSSEAGEDTYRIVQTDNGDVYVYQKCSKQ